MSVWRTILLASVIATVVPGTSTRAIDLLAVDCPTAEAPVQLRCLLDAGRYREAERLAHQWLQSFGQPRERLSIEAARATDYLVEALVKTGQGGSPATLALATAAV